ncbi:MAG: hypothetical protein HY353_03005 [Candidatus Omnitrophica bacterium]|nr:hypothetical protein [Candidatus Omnitrophota bacterium]
MSDVTAQLKQFTARYHTALLIKTAVWGALTLGVAAACWWRLDRLDVSPWWSLGVPTALSLASAAGLAWWLGQRWLSVHDAADRLDATLGLQQRLVTTLEFADTQPPPALYPLLVDDTTQAFSTQRARMPRAVDRASVGLAVVLLVLLLWPVKGTEPIRLAGLPGPLPTTPPPQPDIPPPQPEIPSPTPQDQRTEQQQQQQQQSPSQGQQQSAESNQGHGEQTQQDQQGQGGQNDHQDRAGGSDTSRDQQQTGKQADRRDGQSGKDGQQTAQGQQGQQSQQGQQGQQGQQVGGSDQQTQQALAKAAASPSSRGQQSPGGQDALKADIQQLLKELSGELKDLQEQLAAAEVQSREAGTSTDEQLYGAPEPMARTDGPSLPIQLKTDTAETSARRPSGGLAEPSGEIAGAAPQVAPEIAELSPDSLESSAVSRQRVPPEYQSVFDRLFRRNQQPSETKPQ